MPGKAFDHLKPADRGLASHRALASPTWPPQDYSYKASPQPRDDALTAEKQWLFLMSCLSMSIEIWFFDPKIQVGKKHLLPTFPIYFSPNYGYFLI